MGVVACPDMDEDKDRIKFVSTKFHATVSINRDEMIIKYIVDDDLNKPKIRFVNISRKR